MNKKEFASALNELKEIQTEYLKSNDLLKPLFGTDSTAENAFLVPFFKMRDLALKNIAELVDDNDEWVYWYVAECEFKPTLVKLKGAEYDCGSPEDLYEIIKIHNSFMKAEE